MNSFQACKLGDLVEIRTGFTLRKRPPDPMAGDVRLLGASDIQPPGQIVDDLPLLVDFEQALAKYEVKPGDVLFKSRGSRFDAAYVGALSLPTFYMGSLFKLDCDESVLEPRYLAWFLNSAPTQRKLERVARGSTIQTVGANALRKIEISVPPLEIQTQIVDLDALRLKESDLAARLVDRRKQHLDFVLMETARAGRI